MTKRSKKALVERMLGGELTHHLVYPPGGEKPTDTSNQRNGTSDKTVLTDDGPLVLDIPRDCHGTSEPQLIGKPERRFAGFDDTILALYARGLTVREIQAFLALAVLPDGRRDILGIWIEQTEGAKFWMKVFTDLKSRARRVRARGVGALRGPWRSMSRRMDTHHRQRALHTQT